MAKTMAGGYLVTAKLVKRFDDSVAGGSTFRCR
jgi:hypothetical protein